VSELLGLLGADILIFDKYNEQASNCTLEEGLNVADVISIHASGKDEILTSRLLGLVKPGVVILNSARGALINEDALYEGLKSDRISYFWGDALWQEPYNGKIIDCENAILTPHISTYTKECRESMETQAVKNLLEDLANV
jgi:D-3-phosphoglycerate dehydrogenase